MPANTTVQNLNLDDYKYGFRDPEEHVFRSSGRGSTRRSYGRSRGRRMSRSGC
jgi:hypothetical protein